MSNVNQTVNKLYWISITAVVGFFSLLTWFTVATPAVYRNNWYIAPEDTTPPDTTKKDTAYKPSTRPKIEMIDRVGDPFAHPPKRSPLLLDEPVETELEIDSNLQDYIIREKVNGKEYNPPSKMTFEEYQAYKDRQAMKNYFREKSKGLDGESKVSTRENKLLYQINPIFDRLFGGSYVDIRPNGQVALEFGIRHQKTLNPALPVRQQNNTQFIFDQQISLNVVGKIGEKLQLTANWDTKAAFDFDNTIKVSYNSFDHEILQEIDAGNVSMPISSQLIRGSQNLFGLRTKMKFGKLMVTTVIANQRGKADRVPIKGGAQRREFNIRVDNYEDNRHFFLGQFFHDRYDQVLSTLPLVSSGAQITRLEVYKTNRSNNTSTLRNITAFLDLGEGLPFKPNNPAISPAVEGPTRNAANRLYENLRNNSDFRNPDNTDQILSGSQFQLVKGTDYEIVRGAQKLEPEREYRFQSELGYISLNTPLRDDEVLAVAFEYTLQGQVYKVGEMSEDYQSLSQDQMIILKMLRPSTVRTKLPTWRLMMKNIYSLNASQISREGFQLRVVYRDDSSGVDNPSLRQGRMVKDIPLVQVLNADKVNPVGELQKDGVFDFIERITIDPQFGRVIFPVTEPFGRFLRSRFDDPQERRLADFYAFDALYDSTKADALLAASKAKFFLVGLVQSSNSNEIRLPGVQIARGSVRVLVGNARTPLQEGTQYTVDYDFGVVKILDQSVLNSNQDINIEYEKADLFNFQPRAFFGTRLEYKYNRHLNLGGTLLHLSERPLISRVSIGDEPIKNTIWGVDANYSNESRFLTKMVDALPLIQTKQTSNINVKGEFAQLIPSSHRFIGKQGVSYIDDFEGTKIPFDLTRVPSNWKLASTPRRFVNNATTGLEFGYRRAKLAWYNIDNLFYRQNGPNKPKNITENDMRNHYVRAIGPQEIFKNRDLQIANLNEITLDLAYYPEERGPYNYNPNLTQNGTFSPADATANWAGLQRAVTTDTDFDAANVQYIEFWMLDPFLEGELGNIAGNTTAEGRTGKLYFNLGSISEDIVPDGRHFFENGLPTPSRQTAVEETPWGRVTRQQFLTNAFDNEPGARAAQDVGFDGLGNAEERIKFQDFLNNLNLTPEARQRIEADPSADNFRYYLGRDLDEQDLKVLERYKNFNGPENNSPEASPNLIFNPSYTTLPDNEDLNRDNTINDVEAYYEYRIDIEPSRFEVGRNYIVDRVPAGNDYPGVFWYQFRIPIRDLQNPQASSVGEIRDFKSIRFIRMYMTGFRKPTVLRFANLQMVAGQWREFVGNLDNAGIVDYEEPARFTIAAINVEENGASSGANTIPYITAPGVRRDQDLTSGISRRLNEQALSLCVEELPARTAKAVFKNIGGDFIYYKRLKMFIHAHAKGRRNIQDGEVAAFIRLGTDFTENYYEIEVPLRMSPREGPYNEFNLWYEENNIDIALEDLAATKVARNGQQRSPLLPFYRQLGRYKITVVGNPDIASVVTAMIGLRNNSPDKLPKDFCVWVNELRVTDFDKTSGWAATAQANLKLADLGNVTASGLYKTFGFGGLEQRIADRERSRTMAYSTSANLNMHKFLLEKIGIQLPVYLSYERQNIRPEYDPVSPDIRTETSIAAIKDPARREIYTQMVEDNTTRRSFNLTNIRKVKMKKDAKSRIYDIENFGFTYSWTEQNRTNINTESYIDRRTQYALSWNFSPKVKSIEPFKNVKFMKSKSWGLIKDFNFSPMPNTLSFQGSLDRQLRRTQLRGNNVFSPIKPTPTWEKAFFFNRVYGLGWAITKSLQFNYNANVSAIVDEPQGDLTPLQRDTVWQRIRNGGRIKNFNQQMRATYKLPLEKLPLTDFLSADVLYSANYNWRATALGLADSLGNHIENNRERALNGRIDMVKLYNKVPLLKKINTPPPKKMTPKVPPKKPETNTPKDTTKKDEKPPREWRGLKEIARSVMMVRSLNFRYSLNENTALPGYKPTVNYFGYNTELGAPGIPFILGEQDPNIRFTAARNGWMGTSIFQNQQFMQAQTEDLSFRANLEPVRDVSIQLDWKRTATNTYSEIFRFDDSTRAFRSFNPLRMGTYTTSFIAIQTAFQQNGAEGKTPAFRQFEENRLIILERLQRDNPNQGRYDTNSQDVLLPAFLAAYSGQDANTISFSAFPRIPLPNWRLDYAGLTKIKWIKDRFPTVNITHGYTSTYTVGNYTSSLQYGEEFINLSTNIFNYQMPNQVRKDSGNVFIPVFVISQATITERFSPLFGLNVRTKSNITGRLNYNWSRTLSLNISNSQITELKNWDITLGLGYVKSNMKLPFRWQGRTIVLKNQLDMRCDITYRDTETMQRKINDPHLITQGVTDIQIKPNISYQVNQRINVQAFFERTINRPKITTSFPRTVTAAGFRVRFSLI